MKYLGFDNRYHSIQVQDFIVYNDDTRVKSDLHLSTRLLIKELYPIEMILEEVSLPVYHESNRILYADFLLPKRNIMIEVHGEQHYNFNSFFYKNKFEFAKAKMRDKLKKEWCELNNIRYIELAYNESIDEWRTKLH